MIWGRKRAGTPISAAMAGLGMGRSAGARATASMARTA